MSKTTANEDGSRKKFQLTDSLLRRSLSCEDAEIIEIIEPAIVQSTSSKSLKGLGYKHAVVSAQNLYVVNTPAKSDADLLMNLPLDKVVSVALVYDIPEFLQGELRDCAQHVKVEFKLNSSSLSVQEQLLIQGESLSLLSIRRSASISADSSNASSLFQQDINSSFNKNGSNDALSPELTVKDSSKSPARLLPNPTKDKSKRRPLPKPVSGTEKLNASYTNGLMLSDSRGHSLPISRLSSSFNQRLSPSRSMDNLMLTREMSPKIKPKNLNSSYPLNSSSLANSQTLNNAPVKGDEGRISAVLSESQTRKSFQTDSIDKVSVSLSQSISSRLFQMFKGKNGEESKEFLDSSYTHSPSSSRSASIQSTGSLLDTVTKKETVLHDMHIYTLSRNSKLYSALHEAWVQSLLKTTRNNGRSKQRASKRLSLQIERDNVLNKFTLLKEEVLQCKQDDELFLLTKEIDFACQKYFTIKKLVWKSSSLVKLYMKKLISLSKSKQEKIVDQMDEIDLLILIAELLIHLFEGTELVLCRNAFINEQSNSLITQLIECILTPVNSEFLKSRSKDQHNLVAEIDELIETWNETRIIFFREIICVGEQFNWCFTVEIKKSFDTNMIVEICKKRENELMLLLDHVMRKIIFEITSDYECILSGENFVTLYKYLQLVHFVFIQIEELAKRIKEQFQEEIKYYLSKAEVLEHFPRQYRLSTLALSLLEKVLKELKS